MVDHKTETIDFETADLVVDTGDETVPIGEVESLSIELENAREQYCLWEDEMWNSIKE